MEYQKDWYTSKTIWSALVVMIISILSMFGVGDLEGEVDSITETIMQIVTLVGSISAIIGRVAAKAEIKGKQG